MSKCKRFGVVCKSAELSPDMEKINRQTLTELQEDEVFTFRIAACDNQLDRDHEQFSVETLEGLAKLFVGKTLIRDHDWKAKNQTARIYDACVENENGVHRLMLSCYMIRRESTADTIAAIEGGILREVSVAVAVRRALCSICGTDKAKEYCKHYAGASYDGKLCTVTLDGAEDAYELSFVAVPAQKEAGVVKTYGGEENHAADERAKALLELEKIRFEGSF